MEERIVIKKDEKITTDIIVEKFDAEFIIRSEICLDKDDENYYKFINKQANKYIHEMVFDVTDDNGSIRLSASKLYSIINIIKKCDIKETAFNYIREMLNKKIDDEIINTIVIKIINLYTNQILWDIETDDEELLPQYISTLLEDKYGIFSIEDINDQMENDFDKYLEFKNDYFNSLSIKLLFSNLILSYKSLYHHHNICDQCSSFPLCPRTIYEEDDLKQYQFISDGIIFFKESSKDRPNKSKWSVDIISISKCKLYNVLAPKQLVIYD